VIVIVVGVGDVNVVGDGDVFEKSWTESCSWANDHVYPKRSRLFEHDRVADHPHVADPAQVDVDVDVDVTARHRRGMRSPPTTF
jgi:hypothetical protein